MSNGQRPGRSMFANAGWLFADMFLALMMVFIIASTVGKYTPPVTNKPTPTPTRISGIDSQYKIVSLVVDVAALLNDSPAASSSIKDQMHSSLDGVRNRKAGIVLTFGAGPDAGQDTIIAHHVNAVLQSLGAENFIFDHAIYDDFIELQPSRGAVMVKIYFYSFGNQ